MNSQKDLALFVGTISVATILAGSAHLWIPKFLQFVGTNTSLIQGLTSFIQIILWLGILLVFVFKLYLKIPSNTPSQNNSTSNNHNSNSTVVKPIQPNGNQATQFNNNAEKINGLTQGDNNQITQNYNDK
jgi:hypothetical protein